MASATTLGQRLTRLIEITKPADHRPHTAREIADGAVLPITYVNFLRSGQRRWRISQKTLSRLAEFFGVPVSCFSDEDNITVEQQLENPRLLATLRRAEAKAIATRLGSLSDADQQPFAEYLDRLHPSPYEPGQPAAGPLACGQHTEQPC